MSVQIGYFVSFAMDEAKYQELLTAICDSKQDVELSAAKQELSCVNPTERGQQEALKKAQVCLDEGMKSLEKCQKHIKVADQSDYGWSTVQHYDTHPLASDSDDEKRLEKVEKEAEHTASKRRRGRNTGARKWRNWNDGGYQNSRRELPMASTSSGSGPPAQMKPRPWVVGPCYRCAAWGHLAANCPAKEKVVYPFYQPVVSKADVVNNSESKITVVNDVRDVQSTSKPLYGVCDNNTGSIVFYVKPLSQMCVDVLKRGVTKSTDYLQTVDYDSDSDMVESGSHNSQVEHEASKFWGLEAHTLGVQSANVKGWLKKSLSF